MVCASLWLRINSSSQFWRRGREEEVEEEEEEEEEDGEAKGRQ